MTQFCTNCGTLLGEDGVCPNCGMVNEPETATDWTAENDPYSYDGDSSYPQPDTQQTADPTPEQPYGSYYQPQSAPVQPTSAPTGSSGRDFDFVTLMTDWLDQARGFFTPDPLRTAQDVIAREDPVWAVFGVLNVLVGALCTAAMTGNGLNWIIGRVFGTFAGVDGFFAGYSFGSLFVIFLFSLLTLTGFTAASAGIVYGFLLVEKKHLPFMTALKTAAVAFFPLTLTCAAAFVFSFFLYPMAAVLLLAGMLASVSLFNELIKKQAGEMNFWVTALCNAAQVVAGILIISISVSVV